MRSACRLVLNGHFNRSVLIFPLRFFSNYLQRSDSPTNIVPLTLSRTSREYHVEQSESDTMAHNKCVTELFSSDFISPGWATSLTYNSELGSFLSKRVQDQLEESQKGILTVPLALLVTKKAHSAYSDATSQLVGRAVLNAHYELKKDSRCAVITSLETDWIGYAGKCLHRGGYRCLEVAERILFYIDRFPKLLSCIEKEIISKADRASAEQSTAWHLTSTTTPFVGREDIVKDFTDELLNPKQDRWDYQRTLVLFGTPLSGKSRLLTEVAMHVRHAQLNEKKYKVVPIVISFENFAADLMLSSIEDVNREIMSRVLESLHNWYCSPRDKPLFFCRELVEHSYLLTWTDICRIVLQIEKTLYPDVEDVRVVLICDEGGKLVDGSRWEEYVHEAIRRVYKSGGAVLVSGFASSEYGGYRSFSAGSPHYSKRFLSPILRHEETEAYTQLRDMARACCGEYLYPFLRSSPSCLGYVIEMKAKYPNVPITMDHLLERTEGGAENDFHKCHNVALQTEYFTEAAKGFYEAHHCEWSRGAMMYFDDNDSVLNPLYLFWHDEASPIQKLSWVSEMINQHSAMTSVNKEMNDVEGNDGRTVLCTQHRFFRCLLAAGLQLRSCFCPRWYFDINRFVEKLAGSAIASTGYDEEYSYMTLDISASTAVSALSLPNNTGEAAEGFTPRDSLQGSVPMYGCDVSLRGECGPHHKVPFLMLFDTKFYTHNDVYDIDTHNEEISKRSILCLLHALQDQLRSHERRRIVFVYMAPDTVRAAFEELPNITWRSLQHTFTEECIGTTAFHLLQQLFETTVEPTISLVDLLEIAKGLTPELWFTIHVVYYPVKEGPTPEFRACMMDTLAYICPDFLSCRTHTCRRAGYKAI